MDAISCLAPAEYLSSSAFTDAAIARALHFSVSDSPAASSSSSASAPLSSLLADLACGASAGGFGFASAPAPQPMVTCDSVLVADSARPSNVAANKRLLGPAGGRAGKRRARPSKRAPTTYISTDPANFSLMVQHITGVQAEPADGVLAAWFDASTVLLDAPPSFGALGDALLPSDDAALHHHHHHHQQEQQHHQQPCFPTLDSWSVMYESSELL